LWQASVVGVSLKEFEAMQERVQGHRRTPASVLPASVTPATAHAVILGVDPSLRGTGYGVIRLGRS